MATPTPAKPLAAKTALVVDDEKDLRDILSDMLANAGMKTFGAADGDTAIHLIRTNRPDVILTDIKMPGKDGNALLRSLYLAESAIPIIVITGSESRAESAWSELGVFSVLTKPFDDVKIIKAVGAALGVKV